MTAPRQPEVALVVARAGSPFLPRAVLAEREAACVRAAAPVAERVEVSPPGEDVAARVAAAGAGGCVIVTWRFADLCTEHALGPDGAALLAALAAAGTDVLEMRHDGTTVAVDVPAALAARPVARTGAQDVRQTHAAMTRYGRRQVAREGRWLGGRIPLGWQAGADGRVVLDLAAATHIRAATRGVAAGRTAGAVAAQWNAAGFTTLGGRPWTAGSARRVLLRARNAGLSEYRGEVVGRSVLPSIVTVAEWRAAVEALTPRRRERDTA